MFKLSSCVFYLVLLAVDVSVDVGLLTAVCAVVCLLFVVWVLSFACSLVGVCC